jgi:Response regulators consisting of a CheY-like receiver domain and a winged-helix DNA-binding domain
MKHILIIEDDMNIAELERDYLQLNGYVADIVQDGAQGLLKALACQYDVIIVDLMLPNKNGYEIIKKSGKSLTFQSL